MLYLGGWRREVQDESGLPRALQAAPSSTTRKDTLRVVLYEVSSPLRALGTRGWGDKRFRGAVRSRYNPMNVAVCLPTPLTGVTLMLATRPISVAHAIAEAGRREATP